MSGGDTLSMLWFDVENERYTTSGATRTTRHSCGLMQKMKDIQQGKIGDLVFMVVV